MDSQVYSPALYKDRAEWSDVKPVYNSEREDGVVKIAATEECNSTIWASFLTRMLSTLEINLFSHRCLCLPACCVLGGRNE